MLTKGKKGGKGKTPSDTQGIWPRLPFGSKPTDPLPAVAVPAALSTLAAALMHKQECTQLTSWLQSDAPPLVTALLHNSPAPTGPPTGPPERLTVLRGVTRRAPPVVLSHWGACLAQATALVATPHNGHAPPSEHCTQQGVLLVAALLSESAPEDVGPRWGDGCEMLMQQALTHPSCLVRCAGSILAAAVPAGVLGTAAVDWLVRAVHDDADAASRAAALKALGVVGGGTGGVQAALAGLRDRTLSVRVAAAWAAANMCDTLRQEGEGLADDQQALCHGTLFVLMDGVLTLVPYVHIHSLATQR